MHDQIFCVASHVKVSHAYLTVTQKVSTHEPKFILQDWSIAIVKRELHGEMALVEFASPTYAQTGQPCAHKFTYLCQLRALSGFVSSIFQAVHVQLIFYLKSTDVSKFASGIGQPDMSRWIL